MKLVCWDDYALPVPDNANWITFDLDGRCFWWETDECLKPGRYFWHNEYKSLFDVISNIPLNPPEKGHWKKQIYYLEDQ